MVNEIPKPPEVATEAKKSELHGLMDRLEDSAVEIEGLSGTNKSLPWIYAVADREAYVFQAGFYQESRELRIGAARTVYLIEDDGKIAETNYSSSSTSAINFTLAKEDKSGIYASSPEGPNKRLDAAIEAAKFMLDNLRDDTRKNPVTDIPPSLQEALDIVKNSEPFLLEKKKQELYGLLSDVRKKAHKIEPVARYGLEYLVGDVVDTTTDWVGAIDDDGNEIELRFEVLKYKGTAENEDETLHIRTKGAEGNGVRLFNRSELSWERVRVGLPAMTDTKTIQVNIEYMKLLNDALPEVEEVK